MLKKALFIFLVLPLMAQAGKLDRIKRAIEGADYEKADELIQKTLEKEPFNPGASYFQALLFQTPTFQRYHLDSARIAINKSIVDFEKAAKKTIEDLEEDGISLSAAKNLQSKIKDKQFQELLSELSIENVASFRSKYPTSVYDEMLEFKRDSIIFFHVKENPTQQSVTGFIEDYPASIFVPEAKDILDELNYLELKSNGQITDYYQFLSQHPRTHFRADVEKYILLHSTLDQSIESYLAFLKISKTHALKKKAADLLYYCSNQNEKFILDHPLKDSLQQITSTSDLRLFPVMDRNKFGFITQSGQLQVLHQFDEVQSEAKCISIEDDWILVQKNGKGVVIDRLGNIILDHVDNYSNLSAGAALVTQHGKNYLYHKSGFKILSEAVENAEVLGSRWIKVKKSGKTELISFLGIPITETKYDDIYLEGPFWVFKKRDLLGVYTEKLIGQELHNKGLSLEFKFDDLEVVNDSMFIGFRDTRESLIDQDLNFLIPWGNYVIHPDESGWYLTSEKGYQLYNSLEEDVLDRYFPYLESNNGWLALETEEDWMLLPRHKAILPSRGYDSLKLINDYVAYTKKEDVANILFSNGNTLELAPNESIKTFPNSKLISVKGKSNMTVYNENGALIIKGNFEQITLLNDSLLKVEINKKQGLMNLEGEFILRPVFDVIDKQKEMIFLLDGNKIGCLDLAANIIFMPKYESRIEKIGKYYSAKKDGKYGLFDLEEQLVLEFQYDEIHFWNDSSFRIKKDNQFAFMNHNQEVILENIELMSRLINAKDYTIWKFVKDGKYGIMSTKNGVLLEPEFTDIFNIGTQDEPLFFSDQHLNKAGYHVVSYINKKGELIFSKAYTLEEFDKILCED